MKKDAKENKMTHEESIYKLLDEIVTIEKNFSEYEIKQIASILIARLLTTTSSKETAELIIGMAQIEEEAEKITEEKETKLH